MKKAKSPIGNADPAAAAPPIIIKEGGSSGITQYVALGLLAAGALYFGDKYLTERKADKAEGDTSDEAKVANQFKTVFGGRDDKKWYVNDADYKAAALLLNDANKKRVYEIYKDLTDRNLSDDIASHISPENQAAAAKIQQYNSKPGKLFSIDNDGNIKFEVIKNDYIGFAKGQTAPVTVYNDPFGLLLNEIKTSPSYPKLISDLKKNPKTSPYTVSVGISPSTKKYLVLETREIPVTGTKEATDYLKLIRPYVKTKKVLAAVKILAGYDKNKKPVYAWVDARDMVNSKTVSGLGGFNSALI